MMADEASPLLASRSPPRASLARRAGHGGASALGTPRFPFHPNASATPRWRRLLLHVFDGHRRLDALEDRDVWPLEPQFRARQAVHDVRRAVPTQGCGRLLRALWTVNKSRLLRMGAWNLLCAVLGVVRPLLLLHLCNVGLSDITTPSERRVFGTDWNVVGPVVGIMVAHLALELASVQSHTVASRVSLHVSQSLSKMIMDTITIPDGDSTKTSSSAQHSSAPATSHKEQLVQITSMLSTDLRYVSYVVIVADAQFLEVAQLAVSLFALFRVVEISWSVIGITVATYTVVLAVEITLAQYLTASAVAAEAGQLNTLYDCLKSIQMVKLSAWEDKIESKIGAARSKERRGSARRMTFWMCLRYFLRESPLLLAALAFGSASTGSTRTVLTPGRVFTALVLICDCRFYAADLIPRFNVMFAASMSWQRIEAFLDSSVFDKKAQPTTILPQEEEQRPYVAKMDGACIGSGTRSTSSPAQLLDVHWTIHQGDLVVIHGPAGVGKSTLLAALRGDQVGARLMLGSIETVPPGCRIAYCSQDPWLQTKSIRDNILFGTPFQPQKYWAIVDACGLLEDLVGLRAGDATHVGPRGINLSSGQSARIALARACYADADLYLLDCPLASVDAVVQSDIFRKCIVELLMFKTVVIVTHNPEYIGSSSVDQLVEVKPFAVHVATRTLSLVDSSKQKKALLSSTMQRTTRRTRDYQELCSKRQVGDRSLSLHSLGKEAYQIVSRIESLSTSYSKTQALQQTETTVAIARATLSEYFLGGGVVGIVWLALAILLSIVWITTSVTREVWILQWATPLNASSTSHYIYEGALWYGYLVLASITLAVMTVLCVFAFNGRSAASLFQRTTYAILHATMGYHYQTRTGEIINRYQQNMGNVEGSLPRYFYMLLMNIAAFLGRAAVFGYVLGPVGLGATVLGYVLLVRALPIHFYQQLAQTAQRSQAEQLSLLSEALEGEAVIRAFANDSIARVIDDLEGIIEQLCRVEYMGIIFNSHVILNSTAAIIVLAGSLLAILFVHPVTLTELLLVLFYIFTMHEDLLAGFATSLANTWSGLYDVQLLREFRSMPAETDAAVALSSPPQLNVCLQGSWPQSGRIMFENVRFAYVDRSLDSQTPLALDDVSFSLHSGEKIGVIGRTGSGKSSLAMALLRVHPLRSGRILLDGVDLRDVPLAQLRRSFTMIPQSPTFYRCSVRDYLDPFHESDDARLWRELLSVDLGTRVQSLDEELLDNGDNWSLGQRQLLCFARALLKPSRVVVLDEAFSCVDQSCQERVLRIVHERLSQSTVLLITHRIDQIVAFDRILVMGGGRLLESGSATELASDAGSAFYEFLETSLLTL